MHAPDVSAWIAAIAALFAAQPAAPPGPAAGPGGPNRRAVEIVEKVIAGTPGDFMEVRQLVIHGSNYEIGRALARTAQDRFHARPPRAADPLVERAEREYLAQNDPVLYERIRGAADEFGVSLDDDSVDLCALGYPPAGGGCSVVFYPPSTTVDGRGILSRNYDFTTGGMDGKRVRPGHLAGTSRPYVIELHPDVGYASLYLCSYDLLGGTIDGINEEGLCGALLADDEIASDPAVEPAHGLQVGLNEIQVLRYLLDNCANTDEAKAALLRLKLYYSYVPCHYIVADRRGKSFVWEYSAGRNVPHIIDGGDEPLITTNFLLHRHPQPDSLPAESAPRGMYNRFRDLRSRIIGRQGKFDVDFAKQTNACVVADRMTPPDSPYAPSRTLWHAVYIPDERSLEISFYLRDESEGGRPPRVRIVRSKYLKIQLGV